MLLVGGFNHLEKYEFVNGKDYPIYYRKWKMFQTTNQVNMPYTVHLIYQMVPIVFGTNPIQPTFLWGKLPKIHPSWVPAVVPPIHGLVLLGKSEPGNHRFSHEDHGAFRWRFSLTDPMSQDRQVGAFITPITMVTTVYRWYTERVFMGFEAILYVGGAAPCSLGVDYYWRQWICFN